MIDRYVRMPTNARANSAQHASIFASSRTCSNQSRSSVIKYAQSPLDGKFRDVACDTIVIVVRMTPDKRRLIKAFVENKGMAEAVKSVLLESIPRFGFDRFISTLDRTIPDAEYGQRVKMRAEAAKILEDGFAQRT
jgi:hypothetical protein